jgi:hypothetical protein
VGSIAARYHEGFGVMRQGTSIGIILNGSRADGAPGPYSDDEE